LRVHPDKVPEALQARAKAAFEKAEAAAAAIEAFCEADAEATSVLHRILHAGGGLGHLMSPGRARAVLGLPESGRSEESTHCAAELREALRRLGIHSDGSFGHPDQERAARLLDEAVDTLTNGLPAKEEAALQDSVKTTRALGLRDLKVPRPMVLSTPHVEVVLLEAEGHHHLALLSDGAAALEDEEVVSRVASFPGQPKAASLLVAADAAARSAERGAKGLARCASCIVGVFQVSVDVDGPVAKRARTEMAEKVRARHILLKHRELKLKIDPKAHLRQRGPVTRPLAQAEREMMRLKEALAKDPSQFHILARKHSECESALQPGQMAGDLGWVYRGSLGDPALEELALGLDVNELSDLINSPRGVHIVQRYA